MSTLPGAALMLTEAEPGRRLRIAGIQAGGRLGRRLLDLGLVTGTVIEVVGRHGPGRVVVARGGSRIALGAGAADGIPVEPCLP